MRTVIPKRIRKTPKVRMYPNFERVWRFILMVRLERKKRKKTYSVSVPKNKCSQLEFSSYFVRCKLHG